MINMIISKNILKKIIFIAVVLFSILVLFIFTGCSFLEIIKESYIGGEKELEMPDIKINENEVIEIGREDSAIEKSYDPEYNINFIDDSSRDPFEPFYIEEEDEEEKNVFKLNRIYTENGIEYAELNLNNYSYQLKEGDTLVYIYSVQAINTNSVVLLKGDVVVTVFMDQVYYD